MYIRKALRPLGIVIASLTFVTMIVSASALSSSFAQGEQNFTAKMTDKGETVSVHSPEPEFEENIDSMNDTVQSMTNPTVPVGTVENQTVTTMKLNTAQFQQIDKSEF